jgi:hypothetical protein
MAERDAEGRFLKGHKSCTTGRPSGSKGISQYIKDKTNNLQDLVDMAYTLLYEDKTKLNDKITLINLLLNRALGTPQQYVSTENNLDITIGLPKEEDTN